MTLNIKLTNQQYHKSVIDNYYIPVTYSTLTNTELKTIMTTKPNTVRNLIIYSEEYELAERFENVTLNEVITNMTNRFGTDLDFNKFKYIDSATNKFLTLVVTPKIVNTYSFKED